MRTKKILLGIFIVFLVSRGAAAQTRASDGGTAGAGSADGPPTGSIAFEKSKAGPHPYPTPPAGYYDYYWWRIFPEPRGAELWHCLAPSKPPPPRKRPNHGKPTPCEIKCATTFFDDNAQGIKDGMKQWLDEGVSASVLSGAKSAIQNAAPTEDADIPAGAAGAPAWYDPGDKKIHISKRLWESGDYSATDFAGLLEHEGLHYVADNSTPLNTPGFKPPAFTPDGGEDAEHHFIEDFVRKHSENCACGN